MDQKTPHHADPEATRYSRNSLTRTSIGKTVSDHGAAQMDMIALRAYRLRRVQEQLRKHDVPAILLCDPVIMRYATGVRNMQPWSMHANIRCALVPAEGKAILFEYHGSEHLGEGLETVEMVLSAKGRYNLDGSTYAGGKSFADLLMSYLPPQKVGKRRLAVDSRVEYFTGLHLQNAGIEVISGGRMMSDAQAIKSDEEVQCIMASLSVAEVALHRIKQAIEPGKTEIGLWSILEATNVEFGGEYIDTRLLSSGHRTNPWYQEATDRIVRPRELVALDTDMIGPFGYDADVSRTFFCPSGRPSGEQRTLYRTSYDQLHHNLELIKAGATFREMSEKAYDLPERFKQQMMPMTWHGVGLYGQWPTIVGRGHHEKYGEEGVLEEGMVLSCESYCGEVGGSEGVKLEQQVIVTRDGYQLLSDFPFEEELLGREI